MKQGWTDSQAADPKLRHEEGGYIVTNPDGTKGVVRWLKGQGSTIYPSVRDANGKINGLTVNGEFHTHPNPPEDHNGTTWIQGGHKKDWNAIKAEQYPENSYIISRDHVYQITPAGVETVLGTHKSILGS